MDDTEDEDLSRFLAEDERIKPIDIRPDQPGTKEPGSALPPGDSQSGADPEPPPSNPVPPIPDAGLPGAAEAKPPPMPDRPPQPPPEEDLNDDIILVKKGEYVDLSEKVYDLKKLMIGAGWDQKAFEDDPVDMDLSLFLLDKTEMTRIDEDFIFYNNEKACDGAIKHLGDSRTGAGGGDDENIVMDLNGIPFDVLKILCVFSVYDPEFTGKHFGMIKNLYIRFVNQEDNKEIARYRVNPDDHKGGNGMIAGVLIREGPRWIFEALADVNNGGLAKIATDYGIIVKELQSTGEEQYEDL